MELKRPAATCKLGTCELSTHMILSKAAIKSAALAWIGPVIMISDLHAGNLQENSSPCHHAGILAQPCVGCYLPLLLNTARVPKGIRQDCSPIMLEKQGEKQPSL